MSKPPDEQRARRGLLVVVTAVACAVIGPEGAWGARSPIPQGPVRPNVQFGGTVNGRSPTATLAMGCFGAVRPGQMGHPMSGQTLSVFRPEALKVDGFTGSAARTIAAQFADDPSVSVTFDRFGRAKAVPTTLTLPCAGSGRVVFAAQPSSATARPATVTVTYAGQP